MVREREREREKGALHNVHVDKHREMIELSNSITLYHMKPLIES